MAPPKREVVVPPKREPPVVPLLSPNKLEPNTLPEDVVLVLKVNPPVPNKLPPVVLPNKDPPVVFVVPPNSEPVAGAPKSDPEGAPLNKLVFFSSLLPSEL